MSNEAKAMTADEAKKALAEGWETTLQEMALVGTAIPHYIHFQIAGRRQIRATRVALHADLARAIRAIKADVGRLSHGLSAVCYVDSTAVELRRKRDALVELQRRCAKSGTPKSETVIEALFPDIPVKKKTPSEKAADTRWLAIRKAAGQKIDPETAEVDWSYGQTLDPYGVMDEWELPEEFHQIGREHWARSPGSDIWVNFCDLPDDVRDKLWARHSRKIAFPAGLEDVPRRAG